LTKTKYKGSENNCNPIAHCCNFSEFAAITCDGVSQKPCRICDEGYDLVNGCCTPKKKSDNVGNCAFDSLGNMGWSCKSPSNASYCVRVTTDSKLSPCTQLDADKTSSDYRLAA